MEFAANARISVLSACFLLGACTDIYKPSESSLQSLERSDAEVSLIQSLKSGHGDEPYADVLTGESGFCFTSPSKNRSCCKYAGTPAPQALHVTSRPGHDYTTTDVYLGGCADAAESGVVTVIWPGAKSKSTANADRFVDALYVLAKGAASQSAEEVEFSRAVQGRRPESLPEDARAHKVAAEEAVKEKHFPDAVHEYGEALRLAPWWPQGHYNRALILAELGALGAAEREMKRYLLLEPDAENARQIQDKIYAWRAKVK